ncbi:unnamed protein product [Rhodiola kirilowii]
MDARLTTMEEKCTTDMQQVATSIERLSKAMEDIQLAIHQPPDQRARKQPLFSNPIPPLLATPPPATYDQSGISHDTTGEASQPHLTEHQPRYLRTPRMDVPIFTGEGVVGWLYQLNRYFALNHTTPEQMLDSAPLFLSGDALLWFQWKDTTGQISTWDQLAKDLRRRFGPSDYYDAEIAINQLIQTSTVPDYISEFVRLSASAPRLVGFNLLKRFISGLKEDIRHELVFLRPSDLESAMGMARVAEDKLQALRRSTSRPPYTRPPYRPPPNPPQHTPLPIRRLSPTEMAARREKGLCFNCEEQFVPGHKCRPRFQCLLMEDPNDHDDFEIIDHEPETQGLETDPTEATPQQEPAPCITFHALQGRAAPCTLRFQGTIRGQPMLALVDSGSTHNFLQTRVARFLKLAIEPSSHLSVTVGNDDEMKCEGICREVPVMIDGAVFSVELHLLPVFGADLLVLGAQWLRDVGPTTFCFRDMWMSLLWDGAPLRLQGLRPPLQLTQSSIAQVHKTVQ